MALLFADGTARADQATSATVHLRLIAPTTLTASVDISGGDPPRQWSTTVNTGETATIHRLPPATYSVTVTSPGGVSATTRLDAAAGAVIWLEATLAGSSEAPHVAIVDHGQVGHGTSFTAEQLRALPSGGSLWGFIDTAAPFIVADRIDGGGLGTATAARVSTRGASWTTTTLSWGGLDAGPPTATGALPFYPDLAAVDAVTVSSGMTPPDMASSGLAIGLTPRRPGSRLRGGIDASFSTPGMVSPSSAPPGQPPIGAVNSWNNVNLQVGGPVREHVGAFVSVARTRVDMTERGRAISTLADTTSVFTHIVMRPTDRDEVRLLGAVQRLNHDFDGRAQFADTAVTERDTFGQAQVSWDHQGHDGSQRELSMGFERGTFTPLLGVGTGGTIDRVFDGVVPPPAAAVVRSRWAVRLEVNPRATRRLGDLRFVLDAARTSTSAEILALPSVAELVDGIPARVWVPEATVPDSQRHVTDVSVSISDSIPVASRLTLDLGVRAEVSRGAADGATAGISWRTLSPRMSVRWAPRAVTLSAGFSRYHPRLSADLLAFGDPGEPRTSVHRWHDTNEDHLFGPGEAGALVALAGRHPSVARIDPDLPAPTIDEFALSAERRLGQASFVRATAVVRHGRDISRSVDTGAPASSYRVVFVPDGNPSNPLGDGKLAVYDRLPETFGDDRYVLTTVAGDTTSYEAVEVVWGLHTARWYSMAAALAYRAEGAGGNRGFRVDENDAGVIGELFEDPNAARFSRGRLFVDRAYTLNWSTSYRAPGDVLFSVTGRYQDGQPFSRLVVAANLAQGAELVAAAEPGGTRFTFAATLDLRVEKGFAIGRGRAAVRVDVFNLTNHGNEVEEYPIAGPTFRRFTAVQPPRTFRLGFRFEY